MSPASRRQSAGAILRKHTQPTKIDLGISEEYNFGKLHARIGKFNPTLPVKRFRPVGEKNDDESSDLENNFGEDSSPKPPGIFFFTECQNNNRKTKEFMDRIKIKLFYKQLDDIIIDFLFQQYNQLNIERGDISYDMNDPYFKMSFIRNNRKLIRFLREKLCTNKEFYHSLYTNTFMNSIAEEVQEQQQQAQRQVLLNTAGTNFRTQILGVNRQGPDHKAQSNGFNFQLKNSKLLTPNFPFSRSISELRNPAFSPKKASLGSIGVSSGEINGSSEILQPPSVRDRSLDIEIKRRQSPEEIDEEEPNSKNPKEMMVTKTPSVETPKLPKINPLARTLSNLSFKNGQHAILELQTSTPIAGMRRSNSQYLVITTISLG